MTALPSEPVQDSLDRHRAWLKIEDCPCTFAWKSLGRLYGVSMGSGWVRMNTVRGCRHHDTCGKAIRVLVSVDRPAWRMAPRCHRINRHDGPCAEEQDAQNAPYTPEEAP